ncbi:MAG: tetratricopeptide repeat protein [Myxococcota bacterium]
MREINVKSVGVRGVGLSGLALALACLAGMSAPSIAAAQGGGMCISGRATQNVEQCPSGAPQAAKRAASGEAPRSRLRTSKRRAEEKKQGPTGPSIELDAATRRNRERVEARAWDLLQREVRVLQRLVRNTRQSDQRRPDILLRQAETYFEMQTVLNARVRSFDEPMFRARRAKNAAKVRQLAQQQRQAQERLTNIRQEAIRTYATLVQDHPTYRRMDEVLFSLAFGLEELRQQDRARQVYHRLIKGYPQSRFVPHAYLSFAEFYFNEADMRAALQFYSKVTEFPPDRNPVYGYSLYKSAWAHYNVEDFRGSLQSFVEVIEFATQNPNARDAENLARQSRREMVLPYAMVGSPNQALDFFRRYTTSEDQALETFETLGELYYDTGQWPDTISVYQKLISERPTGDKTCYWQSRIANAIVSSRPKDEQVREVQRMVDLFETFSGQNHPQESVAQCKQETATILVELATAWHREAIGTDTQPGTNDRGTMRLAASLYEMVIEKFPDMEQMQFPNIDRRDWPTQYKVAYYYAELLWKMEDWTRCGPAFDKVVEINPSGEFTSDAAYAAVLCYNNLYQQQYQSREREVGQARRGRRGRRGRQEPEEAPSMEPREFTDLERGMLGAFQRYVCFIPDSEDLPTIKYRRARIYYEANQFQEAAVLFKDIAWNHRDSELAVYAANLYLDSLNVMGTRIAEPNLQCIRDLGDSIDPLDGFYCDTDEAFDQNQELCSVLERLRCGVMRKEAEALRESGRFADAARKNVEIFRRFRRTPEACAGSGANNENLGMDEVLWNAAINFEAARLLGRAIQVRKVLIERFPDSDLSKRAVYLVGANYHALAIYGQAAQYYEDFARQYPGEDGSDCTDEDREANTCAVANEALQNAVFFRLGLGEEEQAIDNANMFARNYRRRLPRQTSQVIFSIGTIYERQENWTKVVDHYRGFLRTYRRDALPQQLIAANVHIGKAYWRSRDRDRAESFFRDAFRAWSGGAEEAIGRLPDASDQEKALWLYEAKDAASEALFYLAEYKFAEVRSIRFPTYRGGRSLDRVNSWAQDDFAGWITEKREAVMAAQAEYERIAALEIPRWEIAAAARIGEMWRSFVDEFRDAPIPTEIENDPELFDIYVGALDEQSEPFAREAISKFEFCLITATRVRWFNEFSQQCEQELNRLNPREYPLAAELRGQPGYVNSTAGRPRPMLELSTADDAAEENNEVDGGGES